MRVHLSVRSRAILAMAAASVPLFVGGFAFGQTYSTTPVTVYAPGSGTVTDGVNSNNNTSTVIERDNSVIAGYADGSSQQIYYLTPQQPFPDTASVSLVSVSSDATSTTTPSLDEVSASGEVLGQQTRTSGGGTDLFTYNGSGSPVVIPIPTTFLGPTGSAVYSFTNSSSVLQYGMGVFADGISSSNLNSEAIGTGGIVAGTVARYAGTTTGTGSLGASASCGTDGFYYTPTSSGGTSTAIGLTGGVYNVTLAADYASNSGLNVTSTTLMVQSNSVTGTAGANVAGYATRYNSTAGSLGYDAWYYTPGLGTNQIGLTGGIYTATNSAGQVFETSQTYRTNAMGQVAGKSSLLPTPTTTGQAVMWLYTPPAGGGTPGTASTFGNTSAGTYTQLGLTSAPSGTTLGFVNPNTSGLYGNIEFLKDNGTAAGVSNRYDSAGTYQGGAPWYFNGTTSVNISPSGPEDLAVSGGGAASSNTVTAMNNNHMVAGYATRYPSTLSGTTSTGNDAWVYDASANGGAGQTFLVDPTYENNTSNYEYSYIGTLGDNGEAVGFFGLYSGATASTVTGYDLFVWNENTGPEILANYPSTSASLTSTLANYVSSFEFGPDGTLYGPNTYSGATSIVAYSAVPEPSTLGLLAVGALGLLRRRRRLV